MPYIGRDWRSPGDKWIRTDVGWKRLVDTSIRTLQSNLLLHGSNRSSSPPTAEGGSGPTSRRLSPRGSSPNMNMTEHTVTNQKRSVPTGNDGTRKPFGYSSHSRGSQTEEREKRIYHLNLLLSQRCVTARSSSKESNHYSTVSDALNKLSFEQALLDENCFPFICRVVSRLYEVHQGSISGSLQTSLLRITETAKDIALEKQQHSGLVLTMIESAIATRQKTRKDQFNGFAMHNVDMKIKGLLKMKYQILNTKIHRLSNGPPSIELSSLPHDCLRYIVSYLTHPKDILNIGLTCLTLHSVTEENWIWRGLTHHHFGKQKKGPKNHSSMALPLDKHQNVKWKDIFIEEYQVSRGQLIGETSSAICLCKKCNFVFWKSYGHPCSVNVSGTSQYQHSDHVGAAAGAESGATSNATDSSKDNHLTAEQFLQLFVF